MPSETKFTARDKKRGMDSEELHDAIKEMESQGYLNYQIKVGAGFKQQIQSVTFIREDQ